MSIHEKLESLLHKALIEKNDVNKRTLRMIIASLKLAEVEAKHPLGDSEVVNIIQKEIKIREETITDAQKAGRSDLVETAEQEQGFLNSLLPRQLSDEELQNVVDNMIIDLQAKSISDMGKVMKGLLPLLQGRATNERIGDCVKRSLNEKTSGK